MRSYRPFKENNAFNITPLLHQQIKTLLTTDSNKVLPNAHQKVQFDKLSLAKVDENKYQGGEIDSGFSEYLKQKKSYSINHPFMRDKLKASVWEHIHSTIRYARRNNVAMAKLHGDIAGHALDEIAHFINDEEYSELVFEVEECFENSKIEIGQEV